MPQEWPSEDEDFDATADANAPAATADKPSKSVKVVADEPAAEAEPTPEETPAEEAPAEEAAPEPEASEPEVPATEESPVPPTPVVAAVAKPPKVPKSPKNNSGMLRLVGEGVLLLLVIGLGFWAWNLSADNKNLKSQVANLTANPQATVQKQTDALITAVGKLLTLPTGETPTIANVTAANAAKKQSAFFNSAQNGDKVLMYVKAGEAILYRPSTNKIILVAPLTFSNSTSTSSTTKSTTTTPTTTTTTKKP